MEILWTPIIGRIGYESKGRMVSYVYSAISHLSRFSESFGVKEINWSVTAQFMNRRDPQNCDHSEFEENELWRNWGWSSNYQGYLDTLCDNSPICGLGSYSKLCFSSKLWLRTREWCPRKAGGRTKTKHQRARCPSLVFFACVFTQKYHDFCASYPPLSIRFIKHFCIF